MCCYPTWTRADDDEPSSWGKKITFLWTFKEHGFIYTMHGPSSTPLVRSSIWSGFPFTIGIYISKLTNKPNLNLVLHLFFNERRRRLSSRLFFPKTQSSWVILHLPMDLKNKSFFLGDPKKHVLHPLVGPYYMCSNANNNVSSSSLVPTNMSSPFFLNKLNNYNWHYRCSQRKKGDDDRIGPTYRKQYLQKTLCEQLTN